MPAAQGVPDEVGAVQGLRLVRVDDEMGMRTWNELMLREHPRGAGPLVGAQVRYLIGSAHGCCTAAMAFGHAWLIVDREGLSLVDRFTRSLIVPKATLRR